MIVIQEGVWCDPCLESLVRALNDGSLPTVASCCGHGKRPGNIALADGRQLFIATPNEAEEIHAYLHTGLGEFLKRSIAGSPRSMAALGHPPNANEIPDAKASHKPSNASADADFLSTQGEEEANVVRKEPDA